MAEILDLLHCYLRRRNLRSPASADALECMKLKDQRVPNFRTHSASDYHLQHSRRACAKNHGAKRTQPDRGGGLRLCICLRCRSWSHVSLPPQLSNEIPLPACPAAEVIENVYPTDPRRQIAKSSPHEPEVSQSKRAIIEITDKSCTSRAPKRAEFIAQINIFRLFLRIRQKRKKMCFQFSNFPSFPRFPTSLKHRREKNYFKQKRKKRK